MAHSGKTMTFATDLVPQENNTYNLGKDNLKWIIRGSLPLSDVTGADDLKAIEAISGTSGLLKKTAANTWALDTNNYVTSSGITSVTIGATSPVQSSTSTAQTGSSASTTISLKDAYGDTKNPYGSKTKNYVLAAPSNANGAPSFRALVAADIPDLSGTYVKKVTSTDNAIVRFDGTGGQIQNSGAIIDDNNNISVSSILSSLYSGYNLCKLQTSASGTEIVIKTKFKFVNSATMPSIRIHGYSYGKGAPLDLTIVYYIYSSEFYVPKVISTGGVSPDIYLFTYTENSIKYVAIGIKSSLGYLGFTVDANGGALGGLNINPDSTLCTTGWTIEHNGSNTSNTLIPAVNTDNCKLVPYLALSTTVEKAISANLTSTTNAVAYYTDTTGKFGSKASANGALYATSANGALQWGTLPIAQGGTGKTSAADAWTALGGGASGKHADSYFALASHNHAASNITSGTFDAARIPNLSWSKITSDKPTTLSGYGITDAKITSGVITLGSNTITPVTSVNGHEGNSVSVTAADLGLSKAMRFIGVAANTITDGGTQDPGISDYSTKTAGDVVIDSASSREYVWSTTGKWELLGGDSSYKTTQTAVTDPTASSTTSTTFIDTISQDANGVITATKKTLPAASSTVAGITKIGASGGAAAYSHTHSYLANTNTGAADRPIYITGNAAAQTTYRMAGTNTVATTGITYSGDLDTGIWYVTGISGTDKTTLYNQADGVIIANKYSTSWISEIYQDYRTGQLAIRGKNNGTWATWRNVLDSTNYTDYTVTKTGSGASGTWNIAITGKAGSVDWANTGHPSTFPPTIGTTSSTAMAGNTTVTNVAIGADTTTNKNYALVFGTTPSDGTSPTAAKTEGLQKNSAKFYVNPSTGALYATKLYSGGTEVSVSGHTHNYLSSISWSGDTNLKLRQSVNGATATDILQFAAGSNITLTGASGKLTIAGTPDTKNTAGSTNSTSKLFLIGATTQAANPTTNSYQYTYATEGLLSSTQLGLNAAGTEKVHLEWNATDSSLDFVFA